MYLVAKTFYFTSDKPHYENEPFEVPSSWVWTTLGDIAEIITGNTPSKDIKEYYSGNIPFFKPTDLEQGIHTKYSKDRLTPLGFEQSRKLPANSVLVTCIGATIGKTGLTTVEGTCNQQINAIIPTSAILAKFLFYVCISDYMQHEIKANASATTLPILNKGNFSKIAITIPPLQEQSRIVKSIEHWLSLVDCIEGNKENLQRTIREAKSKVLDLAIHGKLVPQDPTDEPASELLKRINPNAEITSDNGHYQKLPEGWCLCELSSLCNIKGGKRIPRGRTFSKERTPHIYIRVSDMKNNTIITTDLKYIDDDVYQTIKNYTISSSDLYLTIAGTIGHVGIVPKQFDGMNLTENAAKLTGIICDKKYLLYSLLSSTAQEHFKSRFHQVAQPKLSIETASSTMIYLPPLKEQHRIVAKIEEICAQLDAIEASL